MMTKKDFEAIARAVSDTWDDPIVCETPGASIGVNVLANRIADVCVESNERFDKDRFLRACIG